MSVTSTGAVIGAGQTDTITNGEIWINTAVNTSGNLVTSSGGVASGSTVLGTEYADGGITVSSFIRSGGLEVAESGGTSLSALVTGADMNDVGNAANDSYHGGGGLLVEAGGFALDDVVSGVSGGVIGAMVFTGGTMSGGTVVNTQVHLDSGSLFSNVLVSGNASVVNWGSSFGGTLMSGSNEAIETSGITTNLTVESGGILLNEAAGSHSVGAGTAINGIIGSGGTEFDGDAGQFWGGFSLNETVSGGKLFVEADGRASNTIIESGGYAQVNNDATMVGGQVSAGGTLEVNSVGGDGGVSDNATVFAGGTILVDQGATADDTVVLAGGTGRVSSGAIALASGGTDMSLTILASGVEYEESGGTSIDATVSSGAFEIAEGGGTSISATILGANMTVGGQGPNDGFGTGGGLVVQNGGVTIGDNVTGIGSNAIGVLDETGGAISGGTISDTQVNLDSGSLFSGVVASGTTYINEWGSGVGGTLLGSSQEHINGIGVVSGLTVESGGTLYVSANTSASGGVIGSGGTEFDGKASSFFGGWSISQTVSGGTLYSEANASALDTVVESGALFQVDNGAIASGATVSAGGTMLVTQSGGVVGTANAATVSSGGTLILSSGNASGATVDAGGTEVISTGGAASNTVVDGGTAILNQGGSITGTTQVLSGGTLVISGTGGGAGTIALGSIAQGETGGATLVVTSPTTTNIVSTVVSGDNIRFANLAYNGGDLAGSGSTTIDGIQIVDNGNTLTVTENGVTDTLTVDGIGTYGWNLTDVNGQLNFEICFAEGTLIATPDGEQVVESLKPGDMVQTLDGAKPVKWMGHRSVDVTRLRDPEAGRLVRIQKGAFAENVPHTDLLITPEHSIFVDGVLVPVRLLINGATIARDTMIDSYTYFHVELDSHGILIANGLTTESYLDTGNRHQFANSGVTSLGLAFSENETHASWADAAAPLAVDPATTQPIWNRLAERATDRGFVLPKVETSLDPDLHLVLGGQVILPATALGLGIEHRYVFNLPLSLRDRGGRFEARLVSKSTASADVQPWIDDRRALGVMVESIVLFQHDGAPQVIDMQDDATLADGWWTAEALAGQTVRWTNGDAVLPVTANTRSVEVILTAVTRYLKTATARRRAA